MNIHTNEIPYV